MNKEEQLLNPIQLCSFTIKKEPPNFRDVILPSSKGDSHHQKSRKRQSDYVENLLRASDFL